MWVTIFKLLLSAIVLVAQRLSASQAQRIGKDEYIKQQLTNLAISTRIAKRIDTNAGDLSAADVDRVLHAYYRDGDRQ